MVTAGVSVIYIWVNQALYEPCILHLKGNLSPNIHLSYKINVQMNMLEI
jgi:hypothetical protein